MAGSMKNSNKFPTVVTSPTGRVGGTNQEVTVCINPTRYTGGFNKAACDVPVAKLKK